VTAGTEAETTAFLEAIANFAQVSSATPVGAASTTPAATPE
jgi:hypothetical protein